MGARLVQLRAPAVSSATICGTGAALRWLAELRGLDPSTTHISSVEHIELAETMASLETSIGFARGEVEVKAEALPSLHRVVAMLRRHKTLNLAIEAHCGLEAHPDFARQFARRRALSVRRSIERVAEEQGAPGALADRGRQNARVEVYLSHGPFELPRRRPVSEYARPPDAPAPDPAVSNEAAQEAERQACVDATFDSEGGVTATSVDDQEREIEREIDQMLAGQQRMATVELVDGQQVTVPMWLLYDLHRMEQGEAMALLQQMLIEQGQVREEDDGVQVDDPPINDDAPEAGELAERIASSEGSEPEPE